MDIFALERWIAEHVTTDFRGLSITVDKERFELVAKNENSGVSRARHVHSAPFGINAVLKECVGAAIGYDNVSRVKVDGVPL